MGEDMILEIVLSLEIEEKGRSHGHRPPSYINNIPLKAKCNFRVTQEHTYKSLCFRVSIELILTNVTPKI